MGKGAHKHTGLLTAKYSHKKISYMPLRLVLALPPHQYMLRDVCVHLCIPFQMFMNACIHIYRMHGEGLRWLKERINSISSVSLTRVKLAAVARM